MADIRINALATTAASTASDDYVAIDGSANGTRKLNAYSPTFGGNLTVSGTGTFNGSSVAFANSSAGSGPNIKFENIGGSTQLSETSSSSFYFKAYTHNFLSLAGTSLMSVSNTGNLTVSGTATIKNGLAASATGTAFSIQTTDANSLVLFAELEGNATSGLRYASLNAYMNGGGGGRNLVLNRYGGDVLIGATVNGGNGALQLATHTTSAGGIGFGTDTSLYRRAIGYLVLDRTGGGQAGIDIADAGVAGFRIENISGTAYLSTLPAGSSMILRSGNATTALTLDASQNATFSGGTVTLGDYAGDQDVIIAAQSTGVGYLRWRPTASGTNAYGFSIAYDNPNTKLSFLRHEFSTAGTEWLSVARATGVATFANAIAIGNTVQTAAAVASTHKVTISIGGSTYYLLATNV